VTTTNTNELNVSLVALSLGNCPYIVGFNPLQKLLANKFLKYKNIQWKEDKIYVNIFSWNLNRENHIYFSLYSF